MKNLKLDLLVPVDFKVFCLKSIDYAKKLQSVKPCKIHLIHVVDTQAWWDDFF